MRVNINRQLAGLEDLLFGFGTVTQTRQGEIVVVTKINASNLPFDETQTLQDVYDTLAPLVASVTELLTIYNNLDEILLTDDIYDLFDDRMLGEKASDPTTDNDGDALVAGTLYWNTTDSVLKIYTGSVWTNVPTLVDNLTTDDATKALTASQGKALNDRLVIVENGTVQEGDTVTLNGDATGTASFDSDGNLIITTTVAALADKQNISEKGQANGYASLDSSGLVPSTQLPSYVDDVVEIATYADLPVTGETSKIYIVVADETSGNNTSSYRWSGSAYAMVSNTLSASDVKSLYESNSDTNAFTDALLSKLNGIEALAEVNNISDTNATDLTDSGESTLHYHASDRDRANHTGTQLAETISDFSTAADARIAAASIDDLADVDTSTVAPSVGDSLVWDGSNWVPLTPTSASYKNLIVNGTLLSRQDGDSFAIQVDTPTWIADVFRTYITGLSGGAMSFSMQELTSGANSMRLTMTTATTDLTTTYRVDGFHLRQFEKQHLAHLKDRDVTFQLKFISNVTGTFSIAVRNGDASKSYVTTFTYSTADTEQLVTLTMNLDSTVFDFTIADNAKLLDIIVGADNNGTYQTTTLDQWIAGNYFTSNTTNWSSVLGGYIEAGDLQLEEGTVATAVERPTTSNRVYRYYVVVVSFRFREYYNSAATFAGTSLAFPSMRDTPGVGYASVAFINATDITFINLTDNALTPQLTSSAAGAVLAALTGFYRDARL